MAVAVRSSSLNSNTAAGPTTIVVTKPSGVVDGDVLIAFVSDDSSGNSANLTAPAGWTQTGTTISVAIRTKIFYKVAASEGASYSFGCSNFSSTSSMATIVALTGVSGTTPINTVSLSSDATGTSKSAVAPSITPTAGVGALVCGFVTQGQSSNTAMSTPSGLTSISQSRSPGDSWVGQLEAWKTYTTATATGTQTSTYSVANAWTTFSIALNAAASTPSVTATGAVSLSGSASVTALATPTASGAVTLSGSATATTTPSVTASGSLTLSGSTTASAFTGTSVTASGSLSLGGSTAVSGLTQDIAPRSYAVGSSIASHPTSVSVSAPSGVVDGDLLVAFVAQYLGGTVASISAPAGWTEIGASDAAQTDNSGKVFYKIASSEGVSYSFGCDQLCIAHVVAFSGVDPTTPLNVALGLTSNNLSSTSLDAPSLTPTAGVGAAVFGYSTIIQSSDTSISTPPGLTKIAQSRETATGSGLVSEMVAWKVYTSTSATGTQTATSGSARRWIGWSLALTQAPLASSAAAGAVSLGGSTSVTALSARSASGSLTLGGSATATTSPTRAASGSVTLSGSATAATVPSRAASGSLALSGSTTAATVPSRTASGAVTLGGSASATTVPSVTASGSLTLSGSSTAAAVSSATASGTLALSGSATATALTSVTATGAVSLSGNTAVGSAVTATASGSLTLSGSAVATAVPSVSASGSLTLSGGTHAFDFVRDINVSATLTVEWPVGAPLALWDASQPVGNETTIGAPEGSTLVSVGAPEGNTLTALPVFANAITAATPQPGTWSAGAPYIEE